MYIIHLEYHEYNGHEGAAYLIDIHQFLISANLNDLKIK